MSIQNVGFKTDIFTGTKEQQGVGESLAGLVMGTLKVANATVDMKLKEQKLSTQKQEKLTLEQKRAKKDADDAEYLVMLSEKNRFEKSWNDKGISEKTSEEQDKFIGDNHNTDVFPDKKSKASLLYNDFVIGYGSKVAATRQREHMDTAKAMYTTEISSLNLSNYKSIDDLKSLLVGVNSLDNGIKLDDVISASLSNTTDNMERDFANNKLDGKTKKELLSQYGGTVFGEIQNKNSKEYIAFEKSINNISDKLIEKNIETSITTKMMNGTDASSIQISASTHGWSEDKVKKHATKAINTFLASGDLKGAISMANQWRATGVNIDVIDSKVNNQFVANVGDAKAVALYEATEGSYAYDSKTIANMEMLKATAHINNLDITTNKGVTNAMMFMKINKAKPVDPKARQNIQKEIEDNTLFSGYSEDKKAYLYQKAFDYNKAGLGVDSAITLALDEYDKFDNQSLIFTGKPYGMWAKTDKEIESVTKSFSQTNSTDDVGMEYLGEDSWRVTPKDGSSFIMNNTELKNKVSTQNRIDTGILAFTSALSNKKVFGSEAEKRKQIKELSYAEIDKMFPDGIKKEEKERLSGIMIIDGLNALADKKNNGIKLSKSGTNIDKTITPIVDAVKKAANNLVKTIPMASRLTKEGLKMQLEKTIDAFDTLGEDIKNSLVSDIYKEARKVKPEAEKVNKYFGKRVDGTLKGTGWLGELKMKDGTDRVMTEFSIGVNINGKETEIPTIVPTLEKKEIDYLLEGNKPTKEIIDKALTHAIKRLKNRQSPFKNDGTKGN